MCSCHSILECYNLFSEVKFCFIWCEWVLFWLFDDNSVHNIGKTFFDIMMLLICVVPRYLVEKIK